MPAPEKTISFRLPRGEDVEVYLVRLADGRLVARTGAELAELPPELKVDLPPAPAEEEQP